MITWPVAILGCFSVLVLALFAFFTIVYIKEYIREEKAIKEFTKFREQQAQLEKELVYVIQPTAPVKKKKEKIVVDAAPKIEKNKKDIN